MQAEKAARASAIQKLLEEHRLDLGAISQRTGINRRTLERVRNGEKLCKPAVFSAIYRAIHQPESSSLTSREENEGIAHRAGRTLNARLLEDVLFEMNRAEE